MDSVSPFEFHELPQSFQSINNGNQSNQIQRIYSKFAFYFFNYNNDQINECENETIFDQYLLKNLSESKFITYCLYDDSNSKNIITTFTDQLFSINQSNKSLKYNLENAVNCVICIEKCCFILESICKEKVIQILANSKAAKLNVSKNTNSLRTSAEIDAIEEITNFLMRSKLSFKRHKNLFIKFTIAPILSFLIHRFFYPTDYFKDPRFFLFDEEYHSIENNIKQKISNFLKEKENDRSEFLSNFEQFKKELFEEKRTNKKESKITSFKEEDFIELRVICANDRASFHLVIHVESLHIFLMKKLIRNVFDHEIEFCNFLAKNPNRCFTRFFGFITKNKKVSHIIYEYASNGTLVHYMKENRDDVFRFTSVLRIIQGVQYLQQNSFVHRDLKPLNILVDHDGKALISDFETVRLFDSPDNKGIVARGSFTIDAVTLNYGSPEQLSENAFHITTDIYCLGEILFYIFEGRDPFDCIEEKYNGKIPNMTNNYKFIHKIYHSCVKIKYNERSSMSEIEKSIYSQIDSSCFFDKLILTEFNKKDVIQCFTEILVLIFVFNNDEQMNNFINNQIFSFLFLNSSFESNKSDLHFILGTFYYKGKYVKKDYSKTVKCFLSSANSDNSNAFLALGDLYRRGEIVIQDNDKANDYYQKHNYAENGANLYFDYFFEFVNEVPIEYYNLKQYFIMSDEYHNCYPLAFIEYIYSNLYGIKNDYFEDKRNSNSHLNNATFLYVGHLLHYGKMNDNGYFGKNYENKINLENFNISDFLNDPDNFNFDKLTKKPEQISDILNSIGFLYLHGIIFQEDKNKAEQYFKKASDKSNEDAFLNLGNLYFEKDFYKARYYYDKVIEINESNSNVYAYLGNLFYKIKTPEYYIKTYENVKKSANLNNIYSLNFLGNMHYKGNYCELDFALGRHYIELSAMQNFTFANNFLGYIYRTGKGVQQNYAKSKMHYEIASRKYHASSFYELGSFYSNGEGVDVNIEKAIDCFLLVIKINDEKNLEHYSRNFFKYDGLSFRFDRTYYLAYNNIGVISLIEPSYFNILKAEKCLKITGFSEYCFGKNNLGVFYQFYLNKIDNAEHMYLEASKKKFSLAQFNLGFLREIEGKTDESIDFYIQASNNGEVDLSLNNEPIFDHRLQISKLFILCLANLKICLYHLKHSNFEEAKKFFVLAFSKLEEKYSKYKFVFGIEENVDYKFNFQFDENLNSYSYLRSFILDFPLFNLRNQKNIDLNSLNLTSVMKHPNGLHCDLNKKGTAASIRKKYSKKLVSEEEDSFQYVDFDDSQNLEGFVYNDFNFRNDFIVDEGVLFDYSCQFEILRDKLIKEIENITNMMKNILYTPPYQILFGRMWINQSKPNIEQINQMFYDGLGGNILS